MNYQKLLIAITADIELLCLLGFKPIHVILYGTWLCSLGTTYQLLLPQIHIDSSHLNKYL